MTLFTQARMTALVALVFCSSAQADDITGAGSTFVFPILSKWSGEYSAKTGTKLDYQPIGSGRGIVQIKAAAVDFGASDAPLKPEDLRKSDLGQFPLVIGGIVPVVNIEGVKPGEIRFTGALLADIFLGKVKRWNDPEIVKLNPDVKLPAAAIAVLHRSDSSGTTFNWVNYLSKVSPEWRDKVGEGTAVAWPTGAGGKGNEGVAALVSRRAIQSAMSNMPMCCRASSPTGWCRTRPAISSNPSRQFPGRGGECRLGQGPGFLSRHDRLARRRRLPHRGDGVRPDP